MGIFGFAYLLQSFPEFGAEILAQYGIAGFAVILAIIAIFMIGRATANSSASTSELVKSMADLQNTVTNIAAGSIPSIEALNAKYQETSVQLAALEAKAEERERGQRLLIESYQERIAQTETLRKEEKQGHQQELDSLREELREHRKKVDEMAKQIKEQADLIHSLTTEKKLDKGRIESLQRELELTKEARDILKASNEEMRLEIRELKDKQAVMEKLLDDLAKQIKSQRIEQEEKKTA